MKKVTIEITEKGYKTVYVNGDTKHEEEWEVSSGGAKRVSKYGFDDIPEDELSDNMYYALDGLSLYNIAKALQDV